MVGDSAHAIYQWRGARDIMTAFRGTALTLSQSFRFGPDLATEANRWLSIATAPLRLAGTETIPTTLGPVDQPDAILCRTNVGAMREVMQLLDTDHRVALTGGGESLRALARAADDLRAGRRTFHPELLLFPTWGDLQDYAANDPAGLADDFTPPRDTDKKDANGHPVPAPFDEAEARLAYVAVTRARHMLDLGGLSWINDHPDGTPPA